MIWAGAGALWLAARAESLDASGYQQTAWQWAYLVMAGSMVLGPLVVLCSPEPPVRDIPTARNVREWLQGALIEPFSEFLSRYRWQAVLILGLIAVYRISDVVMGIMANPFYVDMGYSKDEVAAVSKVFGVLMTLVGFFSTTHTPGHMGTRGGVPPRGKTVLRGESYWGSLQWQGDAGERVLQPEPPC